MPEPSNSNIEKKNAHSSLIVCLREDLLYIPVDLAEDSMFPIKATIANPKVRVKISFKVGDNKLTIEKWKESNEA